MLGKWTPKTVLIVGGVAILGAWYLKNKAGAALQDAGEAVNPVNHENVFNRGFNALYGAVTDGEGTAGTDLADWVHDSERWWNE